MPANVVGARRRVAWTRLMAAVALLGSVVLAGVTAVGAIGDVDPNGDIHQYGSAVHHGDTSGFTPASPVVDMAATPTGDGYWLVSADGGVYAFGDAGFFGSLGGIQLNQPIVGIAATTSGNGYWLVATDGGIFAFGDATFHGSMGAVQLNQPIVGMAAHPSGGGYWMVAADGGIFSFGSSAFFGSMGGIPLNQPVVGMAATPSGNGYWMVATDGGIFSFGDATFYGSTGNLVLNQPVLGMAAHPGGGGYWMVARDGGIFAFGSAGYHGSAANIARSEEVTAMAAHPDGNGYWMARAAGPVWPLTGLTTAAITDRPALAVKIDNHSFARGQWGINQADVIVEELVEGEHTRFIAIFHSQIPPVVGPIRSARETDVGVLPMLGRSLLAYSGGNSTVRSIVNAEPSIDGISPIEPFDDLYYRTSRRSSPHNLLADPADFLTAGPQGLPLPAAMFDYRDEVVAPRTPAIPGPMFVDFGGTTSTWTWSGQAFTRAHGNFTHRDADLVPVSTNNVVVLETPYFISGSTGSPVGDTVGNGRGWLLTDGAQIEITWSRAAASARYTLTVVATGEPAELAPGRTWVQLVPSGLAPFNA